MFLLLPFIIYNSFCLTPSIHHSISLSIQQSSFKNTHVIHTAFSYTSAFFIECFSLTQSFPERHQNCDCRDTHDFHIANFSVYLYQQYLVPVIILSSLKQFLSWFLGYHKVLILNLRLKTQLLSFSISIYTHLLITLWLFYC